MVVSCRCRCSLAANFSMCLISYPRTAASTHGANGRKMVYSSPRDVPLQVACRCPASYMPRRATGSIRCNSIPGRSIPSKEKMSVTYQYHGSTTHKVAAFTYVGLDTVSSHASSNEAIHASL